MASDKKKQEKLNELGRKYVNKGVIERTSVDGEGRTVIHLSTNDDVHDKIVTSFFEERPKIKHKDIAVLIKKLSVKFNKSEDEVKAILNGNTERPINFAADNDYSQDYLQSNYEPEQHRMMVSLSRSISSGFDRFLINNVQFSYLRSIDRAHIRMGDKVMTTGRKTGVGTLVRIEQTGFYIVNHRGDRVRMQLPNSAKADDVVNLGSKFGAKVKILEVEADDFFHVCYPDTTIRVPGAELKPVDDFINKLKPVQISQLYTEIRTHVLGATATEHNAMFGEIEYFHVFSEHFRLNERVLFQAVPLNIKNILMKLLNERTGILTRMKYTGY